MTGQLLIGPPEAATAQAHARRAEARIRTRAALCRLRGASADSLSCVSTRSREPVSALQVSSRWTSSSKHFIPLFHGRKTPIKSALLNQKLLSGVGNIYADESLFRAKVRPRRRATSLTRAELQKLHKGLQKVLREAIKLGGSSVSDYVDAEGREGFFQLKHRVYGREGKPCFVCGTPIKRVIIAGRSSHYCPHCQK